jgi:hypothetical protein
VKVSLLGFIDLFFYWDNNSGRASITRKMNQDQAREAARALARAERDKLERVS